MTEVVAEVWYWTPTGMTQSTASGDVNPLAAYVARRDVIDLLEDAHRRGVEAGERALLAKQAWERRG